MSVKSAVAGINKEQRDLAQQMGAERKGAIVYWWLTGIMVARVALKQLFAKYQLDWDTWGPIEQKATVAFRKTLKEVGKSLKSWRADHVYLIRLIDSTDDYIVYGIVREDRLRVQEDLKHDFEAKVKLIRGSNPRVVISKDNGTTGYEIAKKVKDSFDELWAHLVVQDMSKLLTEDVDRMGAVMLRPTGTIYFVPEGYRPELEKLQAILEGCPGDSHLCMVDVWGPQPDLQRDTKLALERELANLRQEMEAFKVKVPRQDKLHNRLEAFQGMKERVAMYGDLLDFKTKQLQKGLDQCAQVVTGLIDEGHYLGSEQQKAKQKEQAQKAKAEHQKKVRKVQPKKRQVVRKKVRK